jgi:hypothetical protein
MVATFDCNKTNLKVFIKIDAMQVNRRTFRTLSNNRNNLLECALLKQIEFVWICLNLFEFVYKLTVNDNSCKSRNTFNDITQLLQALNTLHFALNKRFWYCWYFIFANSARLKDLESLICLIDSLLSTICWNMNRPDQQRDRSKIQDKMQWFVTIKQFQSRNSQCESAFLVS